MSKFGLTEERYNQMMATYDNDELRVEEIVEEWGAELCNQGSDVFEFGSSNLIEILKIDSVGAFEDDEAAVEQAAKDGVKFIPVNELPENFDRKYLGWIDTPENREAIRKYCEGNAEEKEGLTVETKEKAMLIRTNGYEIIAEKFATKEQAFEEMQKQYEDLMPEDLAEEWADCSSIGTMGAILYANGENVYVWKIVEV